MMDAELWIVRLLNGLAALTLSACLSTSATGVRVDHQAVKPDRSEPVQQALDLPQSSGAGKPAPPDRFDLVCDISHRTINDRHRAWAMPYPREANSDYQVRYVIDLQVMRYCVAQECGLLGPSEVASWDQDLIVLEDDLRAGRRVGEDWAHAIVDRNDVTYEMRITGDDGYFVRRTGLCRYESFSGFPPIARRGS